jgi:hypothetical protein
VEELKRVTWTEFVLNWKTLTQAPTGRKSSLLKKIDLSGLVFGKLFVLRPVVGSGNAMSGFTFWVRCACLRRPFQLTEASLRSGFVSDCGCRKRWRKTKRRARPSKARSEGQRRRHAREALRRQKQDARHQQAVKAALARWGGGEDMQSLHETNAA